jgi:CheY-like chemotaxis protein
MPRLLFVDDNIVDHDPGEFPDADAAVRSTEFSGDWADEVFERGTQLGLMGYFIRDLEREGFEVVTATGVEEAKRLLEQQPESFDVVVLDVMMPYLDTGLYDEGATAGGLRTGFILAEEIHRMQPDVPIWLLSQIVPAEGSPVNKATVDDLVFRGVIVGVACKLDSDPAGFAKRVRESVESD